MHLKKRQRKDALFFSRVLRESRPPAALPSPGKAGPGQVTHCPTPGLGAWAKGQRPKAKGGALRFQRLLAGPFHLKPIKMKCKPKSTGKRRSGSYPHLLPALLLSTLRPGRGPGASQISHMPISPGEWPHCGLRQTKIAASSVLRLQEISLQTPESHMWTTMDVVVANERSWSR